MTGWLLRLYPRAWRERYGAELGQLIDDLVEAGETTRVRTGLNLVAGAAVAWSKVVARRAVLLRVGAVVVVGGILAAGIGRFAPDSPVRAYTRTHPLGVLVLLVQLGWLLTEGTEFARGRRSGLRHDDPRLYHRAFWWLSGLCFVAGTVAVNLAPVTVPAADIRPRTLSVGAGPGPGALAYPRRGDRVAGHARRPLPRLRRRPQTPRPAGLVVATLARLLHFPI